MGLFSFRKNKKVPASEEPQQTAPQENLVQKLGKTRSRLSKGLMGFFGANNNIDDNLMEELENQLIMADVGIQATQRIMKALTDKVTRSQLNDVDALKTALQQELLDIAKTVERPLEIPESDSPFVILVIGVNGSGKTTTIGKLAKQLQDGGKSVMLAAGDTFRAAAVEQLQAWGERNNVPVISQGSGADSASVIYDAFSSAKAKGIDVLIADTAGRLHTQSGLMEELKKVKRVLSKIDLAAPQETMIVLDGGTGQNALSQAEEFHDALGVTGITLTKLDGTAKGGIIFSIAEQLRIPLRFIGVGEQVADLRVFDAEDFVNALLKPDQDN